MPGLPLPAEDVQRRLTSPTRVNNLEGQEQSAEHPSPLGNVPIRSPRRKSMALTPGEENMQPDDDDARISISIEQFFEMTGIRFMDDIAAPRRSIDHPSALRPSRRASMEAQIPLAEYEYDMWLRWP